VKEVAHGSEDHGDVEAVGRSDDVGIAQGTARLDDGRGAGFACLFESVGKREEGVGRHDGSLQRTLRLADGNLDGIDAAHLPGSNADGCAFTGKNDGVGLYVLRDFPSKQEVLHFGVGGGALGDDL